jgi:hypothetical protein
MTDLKIRLKFNDFELEIQGDKDSVIQEFKSIRENGISKIIESIKPIVSDNNDAAENDVPNESTDHKGQKPAAAKTSSRKNSGKKTTSKLPKQLMDLNFRPSGKISLKDFYSKYDVKTNFERNVTYVYFLSKEMKIKNITLDHIYTAYKETNQKVPGDIYQSLVDTKKHKGWVDTTNIEDIKLSVQGENYIDHDAPKAQAKK